MNYQRGGSFTVNGWLALLLLAAGLASAATNIYRARHKCIEIVLPTQMLPTLVVTPEPAEEFGTVHAFPPGREVCDSFDTICWTKI